MSKGLKNLALLPISVPDVGPLSALVRRQSLVNKGVSDNSARTESSASCFSGCL